MRSSVWIIVIRALWGNKSGAGVRTHSSTLSRRLQNGGGCFPMAFWTGGGRYWWLNGAPTCFSSGHRSHSTSYMVAPLHALSCGYDSSFSLAANEAPWNEDMCIHGGVVLSAAVPGLHVGKEVNRGQLGTKVTCRHEEEKSIPALPRKCFTHPSKLGGCGPTSQSKLFTFCACAKGSG